MKEIIRKKIESLRVLIIVLLLLPGASILRGQANNKFFIKGHLHNEANEPVEFATVALKRLADSVLVNGTMSDINGDFIINQVPAGRYRLQVSNLGYEPESVDIDLEENFTTGDILLREKATILREVVVSDERIKAVKEADKTTYLISEKLQKSSGTGTELLSFIPGVGVDLMKNISLNGKSNIVIMVDGIERDKNYVGQISPAMIDKVELTNSAGAGFDASVSGVMNIILKKNTGRGLSGHVYAEVPFTRSIIYSFPSYSLNYKTGKLELYTSYNGALSYFDIVETETRSSGEDGTDRSSGTTQVIRQKDWSHRFHLGADYKINEHNQLNLYGYSNPFSREFDGMTEYRSSASEKSLSYYKDDEDRNNSQFVALHYRHSAEKPGRQLSAEVNFSRFSGDNSTVFSGMDGDAAVDRINSVRPLQRSGSMRADYISPLTGNINLEAGVKARMQEMEDLNQDGFSYDEKVFSGYSTLSLGFSGNTLKAGLRSEYSVSGMPGVMKNSGIIFLPRLALNIKITKKQSLELTYSSTVTRPNIYQLNPYSAFNDPDGVAVGNPGIREETMGSLALNYSVMSNDNYISGGVFYNRVNNAINQYLVVNNEGMFETGTANLGKAYAYGVQSNSSLKACRWLTVNSSVRVFNVNTSPNPLARQFEIPARRLAALETGISAVGSFRHDLSVSFRFQYNTPMIRFQSNTFSDALWFVSADKKIGKNLSVGIATALPFIRSFTYHGTEIEGEKLRYHSEGYIRLPVVPAWIKIRYQFSRGTRTSGNAGSHEDIISIPKKGM